MSAHAALALLIAAGAAVYVWAWWRQGKRWPVRCGISGLLGLALAFAALAPPLAHWAHASVEGHMLQHLLLGMYAPLGLVMAAPVTLALRAVPTRQARRLVALLAHPATRALAHPLTALALDIGAMFLLYLTPLYTAIHSQPAWGALLKLHFLLAGCLFTWAVVGPDPAPHRPGPWQRLGVLFLAMALHGALSKAMYLHGYPLGTGDSLAARQSAAAWMYYGGDGAAAVMAVLFFRARRNRQRVLGL